MAGMRRPAPLSLVLGLAAFVAGCGGSTEEGTPEGAGPTGPALSELPAKVASAQCAAAEACFGPLFAVFLNGEDCATRVRQQIENGGFTAWQPAIDAGKASYHPERVQACLDSFTNGGCEALGSRESDPCIAAFDGTVAAGGACTYSFECAGKTFCKADATCPGVCAPRLAAGEACKVDDDCSEGLGCPAATKVCTKAGAAGDTCKGESAPDCEPGLLCYGNDDQQKRAGVCRAFAQVFTGEEGAACSFDGSDGLLCATGLSCAFEKVDAKGLHARCVKPVAAGEACHPGIPGMCPLDAYCDVPPSGMGAPKLDGTCTSLPGDGEPCAKAVTAISTCAPGNVCEGGTCRTVVANGAGCASDAQCWSGSCQSGKCAPRTACSE